LNDTQEHGVKRGIVNVGWQLTFLAWHKCVQILLSAVKQNRSLWSKHRANRAARQYERMLERAIRKNGNAFLIDNSIIQESRPDWVIEIGNALRAHFSAASSTAMPQRLLELICRLDSYA
jgi:hypothetical protein